LVEHHEREAPVPLKRESVVEVEDGLALPVLDPVIARNERVVFVRLPVALLPVVVLAARDAEPGDEERRGELGLRAPLLDEVDDGVTRVVGNPGAG